MNAKRNTIKKRRQPQYALQLANGKSRCFDSAAEMAAWMDRERGLEFRHRRRHQPAAKRDRRQRTTKQARPLNQFVP